MIKGISRFGIKANLSKKFFKNTWNKGATEHRDEVSELA